MPIDPSSCLPPDLAEFVAQRVASGASPTPDDVIAEGLRLLRAREQAIAELNEKIDEGRRALEAGDVVDGRTYMLDLLAQLRSAEFPASRAG